MILIINSLRFSNMKFLMRITIPITVKENANFFFFFGGLGYSEFNKVNLKFLNILWGISNHTTSIPCCC